MAQTYDIYLRKRLTEFDLIIRNLPYRDGLIVYNRMYLDAMVNYLHLQKYIIGENDTVLTSEIDRLLEEVFNVFSNGAELDASVQLFAGKPIGGETETVLATNIDELQERTFDTFQNFTHLVSGALLYDLGKSIGSGETEMKLSTKSAETLKEAFEKFEPRPILAAEIETSADVYAKVDYKSYLKTNQFDLFYLLALQGEAVMNLLCSADFEMWYTLGNAENHMILNVVNSGTESEKFMTYQDAISLIAEVNGMLECFIDPPENSLVLYSVLDVGMKRFRILSDMDDLSLDDFDALTLNDLDYVILT